MAATLLREETKALMAQWRQSLGRRSQSTFAGRNVLPQPTTPAAPAATQQRHLQQVATSTSGLSMPPFPSAMLREAPSADRDTAPPVAAPTAPHSVLSCMPVNNGKQVVLEFGDESRYEVHSQWLRDSNPSNRGADFYRTSASDVWNLKKYTVSQVTPVEGGRRVEVTYDIATGGQHTETFEAQWLHAFAPFVGKALNASAVSAPMIQGTGSMLSELYRNRTPWKSDAEMPTFDAATLVSNEEQQIKFLEAMICPGICLIKGVGTPEKLERDFAGKPIEELVFKLIGKMNQHPVRSTNYGVMRKTAESAKQGADYDMSNPLSMHTDHSVYQGTPGFLQFLYQAEGSVRSKVCDGLALAEYVKEHHPKAYKLLTEVQMTHSSRNTLYTREGAPRSVYDKETAPAPFELVNTHSIIELDAKGNVEKVVQSETKRGVGALPYDIYNDFMEAYELWTKLCEDDRFIKHFHWPEGSAVVTNNYRTLHGRASVPPEMNRTMAFGYVNKILVENRYRLLKQNQAERANPEMDSRWLTRVPNQVLERMVLASE